MELLDVHLSSESSLPDSCDSLRQGECDVTELCRDVWKCTERGCGVSPRERPRVRGPGLLLTGDLPRSLEEERYDLASL